MHLSSLRIACLLCNKHTQRTLSKQDPPHKKKLPFSSYFLLTVRKRWRWPCAQTCVCVCCRVSMTSRPPKFFQQARPTVFRCYLTQQTTHDPDPKQRQAVLLGCCFGRHSFTFTYFHQHQPPFPFGLKTRASFLFRGSLPHSPLVLRALDHHC